MNIFAALIMFKTCDFDMQFACESQRLKGIEKLKP